MHQVLFTIPWIDYPVSTFGVSLFVAAVVGTLWLTRRAERAGMPPPRTQDMVIVIFVAGIVGARLLYMIQYSHQFPDKSPLGLFLAFFMIWKGGIIFYGSALGGTIAYALFYHYVIRRLQPHVSGWQLADAAAPVLALGLAIGRVGCYLNGCCGGQVAVEEACPVPLGAAHFPLLPSDFRERLAKDGAQTAAGFAVGPQDRRPGADPRTVVAAVESGSAAEAAGLRPGDKVVGVNGRPNEAVVEVFPGEDRPKAVAVLEAAGGRATGGEPDRVTLVSFDDPGKAGEAAAAARQAAPELVKETDTLSALVRDWPRGRAELELEVEREGSRVKVAFVPRTLGLYPTQLYETISMVLLVPVLLAFYPLRRHDGQLMTLAMAAYAVHRFVNESLRVEPTIWGTPLTLSQWGSVAILAAAVGLEVYLRRTMPSRWAKRTEAAGPPADAAPVAS